VTLVSTLKAGLGIELFLSSVANYGSTITPGITTKVRDNTRLTTLAELTTEHGLNFTAKTASTSFASIVLTKTLNY
jgi:hypothetical protein